MAFSGDMSPPFFSSLPCFCLCRVCCGLMLACHGAVLYVLEAALLRCCVAASPRRCIASPLPCIESLSPLLSPQPAPIIRSSQAPSEQTSNSPGSTIGCDPLSSALVSASHPLTCQLAQRPWLVWGGYSLRARQNRPLVLASWQPPRRPRTLEREIYLPKAARLHWQAQACMRELESSPPSTCPAHARDRDLDFFFFRCRECSLNRIECMQLVIYWFGSMKA